MKLSAGTLQALVSFVTGDNDLIPHITTNELQHLFSELGNTDKTCLPSRAKFTLAELSNHNGSASMNKIIEFVLHNKHFRDEKYQIEKVVEQLNVILANDGFYLEKEGATYKVKASNNKLIINNGLDLHMFDNNSREYISEQLKKCENKIASGDFDGAITNARSFVETILNNVAIRYNNEFKSNGDLIVLYKVVSKNLFPDPNTSDLNNSLSQVLRGLSSIVNGLSSICHRMGDRHHRKYKPTKHHAQLVCNSSSTLCEFIINSIKHQKR